MFHHHQELIVPVAVDAPNAAYAAAMLEQFGGANGELKACLQYFVQSFGVEDRAIRDLLIDISTEEISHLEVVGTIVSQFLAPVHRGTVDGTADPRMANEATALRLANATAQKAFVLGGGGPLVTDASGTPFTGSFVNATGDLVADLASDFAAELRAKRVYEMLFREIPDRGARQAISFLLEREEAHSALFKEAIERTQDLGVMRDYRDRPFSRSYPDLQYPSSQNAERFAASKGFPAIRGPLTAEEVRVNLARLH